MSWAQLCLPQCLQVKVLISGSSECGHIWRQDGVFIGVNKLKCAHQVGPNLIRPVSLEEELWTQTGREGR